MVLADGSRGHQEAAPYDAIAVHAATPEAPHSLIAQLAPGGRLVVPIATGSSRPAHGVSQRGHRRVAGAAAGDHRARAASSP